MTGTSGYPLLLKVVFAQVSYCTSLNYRNTSPNNLVFMFIIDDFVGRSQAVPGSLKQLLMRLKEIKSTVGM